MMEKYGVTDRLGMIEIELEDTEKQLTEKIASGEDHTRLVQRKKDLETAIRIIKETEAK